MKHILVVLVILIVAGCKKGGNPSNMVKTVTSISSGSQDTTTATFVYDSQNRLLTENTSLGRFVYAYVANTITVTAYGAIDSVIGVSTYYLNAQGLVLSLDAGDTSYYDSSGEILLESNPGDTIIYTWNNGDKITGANHTHSGITIDSFFYSANIDNKNTGQPYYGKASKHLINVSNTSIGKTTYAYTFDAQGRVSSRTSNSNSGSVNVQYTYY